MRWPVPFLALFFPLRTLLTAEHGKPYLRAQLFCVSPLRSHSALISCGVSSFYAFMYTSCFELVKYEHF